MLTPKQLRLNNFSLGNRGEQKAKNHLLNLGYKILEINIRVNNSEIDLIALDTKFDEIVFIEVKTRNSRFFGNPSEAVTSKKLKSMNLVANNYLRLKGYNKDYRFDIIAIEYLKGDDRLENPQIQHFENISWP
ncbi:MAG: YraN family protein [Candidatus Pacebacteria bacterium]|nr:YraN family protein [Candidatus Pacearchaeota archaeon]NCQ65890.1 YraN family protein [Candidatus Paceibacterota bacterium]PJC44208.1 MAG: endonuclease [Candidatus Pacebacteria bacterium CG_4_9_14_0_2_um_filter_34_50]